MFCPRCGRPVSDTANFCGGCGLPKAEIERMCQVATPAPQPEKPVEIDMNDINSTISQLEGDLTGINPVENYTTETPVNTNKVEDDFLTLEPLQAEESAVSEFEPAAASYSAQSDYSKNAPKHPVYPQAEYKQPEVTVEKDQNLTTVDFVWMLLISSIPVIGFLYLFYTAFVQQDNVNKRSWARATMIVYIFAAVLAFVFSIGIMMTSFIYW